MTEIQELSNKENNNTFYIKRDDLLPFSFGGNKVRIAKTYLEDMEHKKCDYMITYGDSRSNLSRVISNMCKLKNIPCVVVSSTDENQITTNNQQIVKSMDATIIKCNKNNISDTIEQILNKSKNNGYRPYYVYGNKYGKGNEKIAMQSYIEAYEEIYEYELKNNMKFDYIFHASGTGITQSGLIAGTLLKKSNCKIIGISIARKSEQGSKIINDNLQCYFDNIKNYQSYINFEDDYIYEGYGTYNNNIINTIKNILQIEGIPLDTTYTGKAFWGMKEYIKKYNIHEKNILFLHTGGLPIFFDNLNILV